MAERSPIFSTKSDGPQIGYVEGNEAFDMFGRKRCNYSAATGNLSDPDSGKIVGHLSLAGKFVGSTWIADKLFSRSVDILETGLSCSVNLTVNAIQALAKSSDEQASQDGGVAGAAQPPANDVIPVGSRPDANADLSTREVICAESKLASLSEAEIDKNPAHAVPDREPILSVPEPTASSFHDEWEHIIEMLKLKK
jgi:hypothetical protein